MLIFMVENAVLLVLNNIIHKNNDRGLVDAGNAVISCTEWSCWKY